MKVGINYRSAIAKDILNNIDALDCVEVNTERFFLPIDKELQEICASLPFTMHGLQLSLGSPNPVDPLYLQNISRVAATMTPIWFSDHIAITEVDNKPIRTLMPLQLTNDNVDLILRKVDAIQQAIGRQFLLENITYYYNLPGNELSEIDFISKIVMKTGCALLLDLNNIYVNSINHHFNPLSYLKQFPLHAVRQIHLAGCDRMDGMMIDTHASSVRSPVLQMLVYVLSRAPVEVVIIERDGKLPVFQDLLDEVSAIRDLIKVNNHSLRRDSVPSA